MNKRKALMLGTFGVIMILLLIVGLRGVEPNGGDPVEGYLRISKCIYCSTDSEDARFSKNPPYFVGEKYYWWLQIKVCADGNVTDVVVYDQLGEEFMIEGVSFVPIERPGPYNYTFNYDVYESGGGVSVSDGVNVWSGSLDEAGVAFDGFVVYWTGETLEAHLEWNVGLMKEGEVAEIYVTVSTDTNLDGQQEFASPGCYLLNSGATVEGIVEATGKQTSAESCGIEIEVLEKIQ